MKKFWVILLSVVLILSGMSGVRVFAEESSFVAKIGDRAYTSLQNAIYAAKAGDEIDVITDITVTEPLNIPTSENLIINGDMESPERTEDYSCSCYNGHYAAIPASHWVGGIWTGDTKNVQFRHLINGSYDGSAALCIDTTMTPSNDNPDGSMRLGVDDNGGLNTEELLPGYYTLSVMAKREGVDGATVSGGRLEIKPACATTAYTKTFTMQEEWEELKIENIYIDEQGLAKITSDYGEAFYHIYVNGLSWGVKGKVYLDNMSLTRACADEYVINLGNNVITSESYSYIFNVGSKLTVNGGAIVGGEKTTGVNSAETNELINLNGTVVDIDGIKADIDGDGMAVATDLTLLRQKFILKDIEGIFLKTKADINKDNEVDIRDLVAMKKYFTRSVVYLSDNGDDANVGDSADKPVKTLDRAIEQVYEGGTVEIVDTYTATTDWETHRKSITITGGTLDATAKSPFNIRDAVKFTDVTLNFTDKVRIYANGNKVIVADDVTVNGVTNIYGGGSEDVASTNLEVYSGTYYNIVASGYYSDVVGDAKVTVGGNVNSDVDETNHSGTAGIMGAHYSTVVGGNTYVTIGGNAKAVHIMGGGMGGTEIKGKTNVTITGGSFMSAYAGGQQGGICYDTELTMTGGTIEQVFGGSGGTNLTGNTRVNILGGTILRRIYGGCYNDLTGSGLSYTWQSTYHVIGNTTVFLSSNAEIPLSYDGADLGVFATSRYKSHFNDENSTIIYENAAAKSKFSSKIGQRDWQAKIISSWPSNGADTVTTQG